MRNSTKRGLFILPFLLAAAYCSFSQSVGIGTNTPDGSAALDISNSAKGLLIPRMSTGSINTIANPAKGLLAYDSVTNQLMVNTEHLLHLTGDLLPQMSVNGTLQVTAV
jgi:hypothetical protein